MKLVLFDIDGTLTHHVGPRRWEDQYAYGFKIAYGLDIKEDFGKYNGNVEKQMAWEILKSHGVADGLFKAKYHDYLSAMHDHLIMWSKKGEVFRPIEDAMKLVKRLKSNKNFTLGILTGNSERIALWKLDHAGYAGMFSFGLYGDEATNRIELAKTVFEKSSIRDIVVIGDTIHDIRCGKAIGATTIGVLTGMHADPSVMEAEKPDILVPSLMDQSVLHFFGV